MVTVIRYANEGFEPKKEGSFVFVEQAETGALHYKRNGKIINREIEKINVAVLPKNTKVINRTVSVEGYKELVEIGKVYDTVIDILKRRNFGCIGFEFTQVIIPLEVLENMYLKEERIDIVDINGELRYKEVAVWEYKPV